MRHPYGSHRLQRLRQRCGVFCPAPGGDLLLDRFFAASYDWVLHRSERLGLRGWRAELLGPLSGDVLEIGAGTGLSLPHYPDEAHLTLLEPSPAMRQRLQAKHPEAQVVDGVAEALPFPDASFDAVVSGLVLCSVDDLAGALQEVLRVLRPGGRFVFIEHVASRRAGWHAAQRMLEPAWKVAAAGCHLTRDTEQALVDAGFELEHLDRSDLPGGAAVVRDAIHGVARKPA